ncbi:MAG: PIN domain-containing protein [Lachnospiraceae bacterium]|nr:PIN domain-containing protein [Lachnospiraceae bacterium]
MLKIIDTNYAIRYIIQDNFDQAVTAKEMIDDGAYLLPESLVEMVYVLSKVYNAERRDIYFAIIDLLQDVEMIDKPIYENAARIYGRTKLDYVDCILVVRHKLLNDKIYTFDKKLEKELKSVELVATTT